MKKIFLLGVLVAFAALTLAGCTPSAGGDADAATVPDADFTFSTGSEQGAYYAVGNALAAQVKESAGLDMAVVASHGSRDNIQEIQSGRAQFAFVQSDVMSYAYEGTNGFIAEIRNFSTVCAMYMEQVQIVTLNPDIRSVSDLAGKTVSVGDAASGVYFNAIDILDAYGVDISTGLNAVYQSFEDSVASLESGEIDAAFIVAGAPTNAVLNLADDHQVYLVSLDDAHVKTLTAKSPYYVRATVPADAYSLTEDASTVAVAAVVIARDDVSTQDVNNFVAAIYDNLDAVAEATGKGDEINAPFAASVSAVPYHQGAYNYFVNKGYVVPLKEDSGGVQSIR